MRPGERLALAAMAAVTLLAPAAYLALIAGAGCLAGWRLLRVPDLPEAFARGALQEYLAWLALSIAALALLVKPLVAPRPARMSPLPLARAEAPALFDLVHRVCAAVGARPPGAVELACDDAVLMRAGASVRHIARGERRLTIGAAALGGLSLPHFAGAVAREAGRCARPDVALASEVIRGVEGWLTTCAREPDLWDSRLRAWGRSSGSLAMLLGGLGGLAAAAPRGILWLLLRAVQHSTAGVLRHVERSADAAHDIVAGPAQREAADRRAAEISALWREAVAAALASDRASLPDDLTSLMLAMERSALPPAAQAPSEAPASGSSQPPDAAAASSLLPDFHGASREVSRLYYLAVLGEQAPAARLVSTAALAAAKAATERAEAACRRFFTGDLPRMPVPAPVDPPQAPADARTSLETLRTARAEMARLAAAAGDAERSLMEADEDTSRVARAEAMVAAGFRFAPEPLGLTEPTAEAVRWRRAEVAQRERAAVLALTPLTQAAARRLRYALDLLHAPGAEKKIRDVAARRRRIARLWPCWRATTRAMDAAHKLRIEIAVAESLAELLPNQREKLETKHAAETAVAAVARRLGALALALGDASDPFGPGEALLRHTLAPLPSDAAEAEEVLEAARQACDRLRAMYDRAIAELAEHAETLERAVGLA